MTPRAKGLEIAITRHFDATPEEVFAQWLDAEALRDWFVPETYVGVSARVDPRVGGTWEIVCRSASGGEHREHGAFREIVAGRRLVLTLVLDYAGRPCELLVEVDFAPDGKGGTVMDFRQTGFPHPALRDGLAEGWDGCLRKLTRRIEAETRNREGEKEIRALFADWFAASERNDLDASMEPIAEGIVSYEHSVPLEVADIAAMREECQRGFDMAGPGFRWDIPDLRVIVRDDIAVTWGLNRMGYEGEAMWSRGTRIFRRVEGRWRMIHQHVSFPADPETGAARMDLVPAG